MGGIGGERGRRKGEEEKRKDWGRIGKGGEGLYCGREGLDDDDGEEEEGKETGIGEG